MQMYFILPKAPRLEPLHQMVYCHIKDTRWWWGSYPSVEIHSVFPTAPADWTEGMLNPLTYTSSSLKKKDKKDERIRLPHTSSHSFLLFFKELIYFAYKSHKCLRTNLCHILPVAEGLSEQEKCFYFPSFVGKTYMKVWLTSSNWTITLQKQPKTFAVRKGKAQ